MRPDDGLSETSRIISTLSALQVRAWLRDRLDNCARLAGEKSGKDRKEWLEDAAYFSASIGLIDWTEAARSDGLAPSPADATSARVRETTIEECAKAAGRIADMFYADDHFHECNGASAAEEAIRALSSPIHSTDEAE